MNPAVPTSAVLTFPPEAYRALVAGRIPLINIFKLSIYCIVPVIPVNPPETNAARMAVSAQNENADCIFPETMLSFTVFTIHANIINPRSVAVRRKNPPISFLSELAMELYRYEESDILPRDSINESKSSENTSSGRYSRIEPGIPSEMPMILSFVISLQAALSVCCRSAPIPFIKQSAVMTVQIIKTPNFIYPGGAM